MWICNLQHITKRQHPTSQLNSQTTIKMKHFTENWRKHQPVGSHHNIVSPTVHTCLIRIIISVVLAYIFIQIVQNSWSSHANILPAVSICLHLFFIFLLGHNVGGQKVVLNRWWCEKMYQGNQRINTPAISSYIMVLYMEKRMQDFDDVINELSKWLKISFFELWGSSEFCCNKEWPLQMYAGMFSIYLVLFLLKQ